MSYEDVQVWIHQNDKDYEEPDLMGFEERTLSAVRNALNCQEAASSASKALFSPISNLTYGESNHLLSLDQLNLHDSRLESRSSSHIPVDSTLANSTSSSSHNSNNLPKNPSDLQANDGNKDVQVTDHEKVPLNGSYSVINSSTNPANTYNVSGQSSAGEEPQESVAGISERTSSSVEPTRLTFLAHGSYGLAIPWVTYCTRRWSEYIEVNPVDFYYNMLYKYLIRSTRLLAKLCGSSPSNAVLVPNVEYGIQSVLNSITSPISRLNTNKSEVPYCAVKPKTTWIVFDWIYHAVYQSLRHYAQRLSINVHVIETTWPATKESIINDFINNLDALMSMDNAVSLACFEHITSPTAFVLPIKELVDICRQHGILTLIDGAHGIGQLDLQLDELKPDFYVTNCHKWLCSSRGCALMYVRPDHQQCIHPLVISWGYDKGFHSEFIWQGTMDYSPMLSAYMAAKLYDLVGYDEIIRTNHDHAVEYGRLVADIWQTNLLIDDPSMLGSMSVIILPNQLKRTTSTCLDDSCSFSDLHDELMRQFQIEIPIFTHRNKRCCRLSVHFYNTYEDVLRLARAVLVLLGYDATHASYDRLTHYERRYRTRNDLRVSSV